MLRTALFAATLFAATLGSTAHAGGDGYYRGPVIDLAPQVSLSIGSLRHDGFRLDVNSGGPRYLPHVLPRPVVYLPPPVQVIEVVPHRHYRGGHWRSHDRRHWRDHDRWDDRGHWDDRGRGRGRGKHGDRSDWRD